MLRLQKARNSCDDTDSPLYYKNACKYSVLVQAFAEESFFQRNTPAQCHRLSRRLPLPKRSIFFACLAACMGYLHRRRSSKGLRRTVLGVVKGTPPLEG